MFMLISSDETRELAETADCIIVLIEPPLELYTTHVLSMFLQHYQSLLK